VKEPTREEKVDRYFLERPSRRDYRWTVGAVVLGLVAAALTATQGHESILLLRIVIGLLVLGFLTLALAGVGTLVVDESQYRKEMARVASRATDAEMDSWLDEAVAEAIARGRARLDLHPDEVQAGGPTTLWFVGVPDLEEWDAAIAVGEDGRIRFSVRPILVAFLSGWRLSTYEFVLSMRSGYRFSEIRKEYHLRQTDGIEIATDTKFMILDISIHESRRFGTRTARFEYVNVTSVERLEMVVSGQRAIKLDMRFDLKDRRDIEEDVRTQNDEFVALLRDHFRHHMGGVSVAEGSGDGDVPPGGNGSIAARASALGRSVSEIAARLSAASGPNGGAVLVTSAGSEFSLDEGFDADTIGLFETGAVNYDADLSKRAEVRAIALMEAEDLDVATLVMCGRRVADVAVRKRLCRLLAAGRQLHLYDNETYRATLMGVRPSDRPTVP
jgi:hypothetical protein